VPGFFTSPHRPHHTLLPPHTHTPQLSEVQAHPWSSTWTRSVSSPRRVGTTAAAGALRRPVPKAVVQRAGCPRDRPARLRRHRLRERLRAAAVVLEPVRGSGEGVVGALLHHAPLRHHARLLEGLTDRQQSRHTHRSASGLASKQIVPSSSAAAASPSILQGPWQRSEHGRDLTRGTRLIRCCVYRSASRLGLLLDSFSSFLPPISGMSLHQLVVISTVLSLARCGGIVDSFGISFSRRWGSGSFFTAARRCCKGARTHNPSSSCRKSSGSSVVP
jgi:hypothetical protein